MGAATLLKFRDPSHLTRLQRLPLRLSLLLELGDGLGPRVILAE